LFLFNKLLILLNKMKKIIIIGSGFSALAASSYLAKSGFEVVVLEKNEQVGGRARQFKKDGFVFDMGPSWYWMPDIFEKFFKDFGKDVSEYYTLKKLNPAYEVYFDKGDSIKIPDNLDEIASIFENIEKGSSEHLKKFIAGAKINYEIAMNDIVYKPGNSPLELITVKTFFKLNQFFKKITKDIRKSIKNERLRQILEFPVLFLGAKPTDTPSFYNFMNYADFGMGTWYPEGGMYKIVEGMSKLAEELGVKFYCNQEIDEILVVDGKAIGVKTKTDEEFLSDFVLSGADYHHTETLLPKEYRGYSEKFWDKKVFSPSSLLFYVGFDKKIKNVSHHTLFFDADFNQHAIEIYDTKVWPKSPLFYGNFPSIEDKLMAPEGKETGFFLIPIAPGIEDSEEIRELYFEKIISRLEHLTGESLRNDILFKESYCIKDFEKDYHSYKGNAYGLANTLKQTAFLRPKIQSKKIKNLFFTGQLTVPGPGVPPALISGKIASDLINKMQ